MIFISGMFSSWWSVELSHLPNVVWNVVWISFNSACYDVGSTCAFVAQPFLRREFYLQRVPLKEVVKEGM